MIKDFHHVACVCVVTVKILKKKFFFHFFFEIVIFFFKWGKKSPKSHWERGQISASEDTKKIPAVISISEFSILYLKLTQHAFAVHGCKMIIFR